MSSNTLWARIEPQLKKDCAKAAIDVEESLSEWVMKAMQFRLTFPSHPFFVAENIPDMGYNSDLQGTNALAELLSDGDTQPPASERE